MFHQQIYGGFGTATAQTESHHCQQGDPQVAVEVLILSAPAEGCWPKSLSRRIRQTAHRIRRNALALRISPLSSFLQIQQENCQEIRIPQLPSLER